MKLLKISTLIAVAAFATSALSFAGDHKVDAANSSVQWTGSKVGGSHTGNIDIKEGHLKFNDGKLAGGAFVIDMTSLGSTDLSGGKKKKLDGHLMSNDFFAVKTHPEASFKITKTEPASGNKVHVVGDITIKGITEEISFDAEVKRSGGKPTGAHANIVIDRSKFDVRFKSGSFFENLGDKLIHDDIELEVSLAL